MDALDDTVLMGRDLNVKLAHNQGTSDKKENDLIVEIPAPAALLARAIRLDRRKRRKELLILLTPELQLTREYHGEEKHFDKRFKSLFVRYCGKDAWDKYFNENITLMDVRHNYMLMIITLLVEARKRVLGRSDGRFEGEIGTEGFDMIQHLTKAIKLREKMYRCTLDKNLSVNRAYIETPVSKDHRIRIELLEDVREGLCLKQFERIVFPNARQNP